MPFLLPYGFSMNLLMPMFIFANNFVGFIASFENLGLLVLIVRFWRQRNVWRKLKKQVDSVRRCFYVFIIGMCYMGLVNTNLGLAMRQKSMFLPAFLVVAMLLQLYAKELDCQDNKSVNVDLPGLTKLRLSCLGTAKPTLFTTRKKNLPKTQREDILIKSKYFKVVIPAFAGKTLTLN